MDSLEVDAEKITEKAARNAKLDKIVDEYEDMNGEYNLKQLAERYDVSKTSIFRHLTKRRMLVDYESNKIDVNNLVKEISFESCVKSPNSGGRPQLVSFEIINKITLANRNANLAGASISSANIIKMIERERRAALGSEVNSESLKPLSRTCGARYVSLIAPVVIRNADMQNKRRLEAKDDIYNQISLAAVATAILEPPFVGGRSLYTSTNIHCIDAMSVLLFDRLNEIVRVGKTIRSEMKSKHRSISKTQLQPQSRTVKCYFDASADGLLNIAIISITDNLFTEDRKWFSLDSGSNDYDLWVLLISKKRRKKSEALLCEKGSNKENCPDNNLNNITEDFEEEEVNTIKETNKNKNVKEPLTISDTMLMTEMLVYSIIPKLISKRLLSMKRKSSEFTIPSSDSDNYASCSNEIDNHNNSQSSSSSSSSSSQSSSSASSSSESSSSSSSILSTSTVPPILIFLDGDYPQTMALVNGVLESISNENISVIKCPGGTSGISQPNDLMKSHMIFRQATTLPNYWNKFATNEYTLPEYWTDLLLPYFKACGVSAASQDTYGFFFSTLSGLISKSFSVDIVKKGFELSGIFPFDTKVIFQQGTSWHTLSDDKCQRITDAIPELALKVRTSLDGSCPDTEITSILGSIVSTNIVCLDSKVLNQRRALWLTPDKARNIYIANNKVIEDEKDMVKQKIEDKTKLAMGKRKREVVTQQVSEGIIEGLRGPAILNVRCFNDCGLTRVVTQDSHSPLYDNWIGCTICPSWFCGKTRCLARFKKHHIMCLSHK